MSHQDDDMFVRYRSEVTLSAEARVRTLQRLHERFVAGEIPAEATNVAPPTHGRLRGLSSVQVGWAVAMLGLSVGAWVWAELDPPPPAAKLTAATATLEPPAAAATPQPVATSTEPTKPAASHPTTAEPGPAASRTAEKRAPLRAAKSSPRPAIAAENEVLPPSSPQPQLRDPAPAADPNISAPAPRSASEAPDVELLAKELQLVKAAQLALRAGDAQRALTLLAEHTWTFPRGQLAEARDVARILALCQAGHVSQSKSDAKRFLQRYPNSPYALRVRTGCSEAANDDVFPSPR